MKKILCALILIAAAAAVILLNAGIPKDGYYLYSGVGSRNVYYCQGGRWFFYDEAQSDWLNDIQIDQELSKNWKAYYLGLDYSADYPATDFTGTEFYAQHVKTHVYIENNE